jgi:hypothetical protein
VDVVSDRLILRTFYRPGFTNDGMIRDNFVGANSVLDELLDLGEIDFLDLFQIIKVFNLWSTKFKLKIPWIYVGTVEIRRCRAYTRLESDVHLGRELAKVRKHQCSILPLA